MSATGCGVRAAVAALRGAPHGRSLAAPAPRWSPAAQSCPRAGHASPATTWCGQCTPPDSGPLASAAFPQRRRPPGRGGRIRVTAGPGGTPDVPGLAVIHPTIHHWSGDVGAGSRTHCPTRHSPCNGALQPQRTEFGIQSSRILSAPSGRWARGRASGHRVSGGAPYGRYQDEFGEDMFDEESNR